MTHTPGPWIVATSCSWRRILTERGEPVIVPTTHRIDGHPDLSATMDDLRLAAAAPRLLAAAKHVLAILDDPHGCVSIFDGDKLRDAIAEAEGDTE